MGVIALIGDPSDKIHYSYPYAILTQKEKLMLTLPNKVLIIKGCLAHLKNVICINFHM